MVSIHSNGSKWAGQAPDSIDDLLQTLREHTLDPSFEDYGNFVDDSESAAGEVRLSGNFYGVSHVFRIDGQRAELAAVIAAIRANQATAAYAAARQEWLKDKAERAERDRQMMAGIRQRRKAKAAT